MILGPLFMVLIAVAIYLAVTFSSGHGRRSNYQHSSHRTGRALEILKERYAKGEITREQFLQMREELI